MNKLALALVLVFLSFFANAQLSKNCSSRYVNERADNTERVVSCDAKEWFEKNYGENNGSDAFVKELIATMKSGEKSNERYAEPIKKYQISRSFKEALDYVSEGLKGNKAVQDAKERSAAALKDYEYAERREEALKAINAKINTEPGFAGDIERGVIAEIGYDKARKGFDDLNKKIDSYEAKLVGIKINEAISQKVGEYIKNKW